MYSRITGEIVLVNFFGNDPSLDVNLDGRNLGEEISDVIAEYILMQFNPYYVIKSRIFRQNSFEIFPTHREKDFKFRIVRIH